MSDNPSASSAHVEKAPANLPGLVTSAISDQSGYWTDKDWDNLLVDIADHRVIPILGSELLVTEFEGQSLPLYRLVPERVAEQLGLPGVALSHRRTLNDVVCEYVKADRDRNTPDRVYARVCEVLEVLAPEPPASLRNLAEITRFSLFVTTTPDDLMERALNEVRFRGIPGAASHAFTLHDAEDLPNAYGKLESPTVYHLFGKLSKSPDEFVISDEDLLEFFYKLQGGSVQLPRLFDALGKNHLLFLGGSLSDWLARFFLRTAKRLRLRENKGYDLFATDRFANDPELVLFLRTFSYATRVQTQDPIAFVDEMHARWIKRHPRPSGPVTPAYVPPAPTMPRDSIFISYASEDREAVRTLKAGLDAARLTVWFDKDQIMAGDDWEDKIEKNIRRSVVFIPVISNNTQKWLHDVYFRAEWDYADTIVRRSDPSWTFVVPVYLDPISSSEAKIPKRFRTKSHARLPGGEPTTDFIDLLRRIVEENTSRPRRGMAIRSAY
jgi:hypothetical protein